MPEIASVPARIRRAQIWWLLFFSLSAAVVAAVSYGMLRSAMVLYTYPEHPAPLPVRWFYQTFGAEVQQRDFTVQGEGGPFALRVYTPVGRRAPVPIVIAHGFAPMGNADLHLNLLARSLTRAGFLVVIPTMPEVAKYHIRWSDVAIFRDAIHWTVTEYHRPVAVLGISFGGGLVVPAATQPEVRDHVKTLCILSGYNDLDRIGRYYIHEPVKDPDGKPYPDIGPNIGRVVIAEYLPEMLPPADAAALAEPVRRMQAHPEVPLPANEPSLQGLSAQKLALFHDVEEMRSEQMRSRFLGILERHRAEFAAVSPSSVLGSVREPIFIMHGKHDGLLPPGEALWTERQAVHSDVAILITPALGHVSPFGPPDVVQRVRVGVFFARMLWAISR